MTISFARHQFPNFPRALKAHLAGLPETTAIEIWFQIYAAGASAGTVTSGTSSRHRDVR
jgi:hypothetical protein